MKKLGERGELTRLGVIATKMHIQNKMKQFSAPVAIGFWNLVWS